MEYKFILVISIILLLISLYFFARAVDLMTIGSITSALLSSVIGFALLSASITLFKLWAALQKK